MGTVMVELPFDGELPELVSSGWCADTFGITQDAVNLAVRQGRLHATKIGRTYVIKPQDALGLWGHRLYRRAQTGNKN